MTADDGGMDQDVQLGARGRIVEHDIAKNFPVDGTVGGHNVWPKGFDDGGMDVLTGLE